MQSSVLRIGGVRGRLQLLDALAGLFVGVSFLVERRCGHTQLGADPLGLGARFVALGRGCREAALALLECVLCPVDATGCFLQISSVPRVRLLLRCQRRVEFGHLAGGFFDVNL